MHHSLTGAAMLRLLALVLFTGNAFAQTGMTTPGQFSVNESGAATYTIPIAIPPGIGGIEPKLALSYNSQAGNGLLGVGWSLSGLSAIGRCPQTMAQDGKRGGVKLDNDDRYCLDGQRLMVVNGAYGADGTEYRTERESFSKIVSYGVAGNGPAWFKVWTKAGQVMEYGNTADSRIEAIKAAGSIASWPTGTVRQWALNKLSDTKGNYFKVSYTEDQVNGDYYPKQIDYTGNDSTNTAATNMVVFEYEARSDNRPLYQAGMSIKNNVRLLNLAISSGLRAIKNYQLQYQIGPVSNRSRILRIEECGDGLVPCLAKFDIEYSSKSALAAAPAKLALNHTTSGSFQGYATHVSDVNGDGIVDLLTMANNSAGWSVFTALGNGEGIFQSTKLALNHTASGSFDGYATYVSDINGDGLADLLAMANNSLGWHAFTALGNGDGTFQSAKLTFNHTASGSFQGYATYVSDINGDGLADLVAVANNTLGWHAFTALGNGDGTFHGAKLAFNHTTSGSFQNYVTYMSDVNGDGLIDLVTVANSSTGWSAFTALGNGDGTFQSGKLILNHTTSGSFQGYLTYVSDVNSDGIADLVTMADNSAGWSGFTALGNGDGTFQAAKLALNYTASGSFDGYATHVSDVNGDGLADLVAVANNSLGWHAFTALGNGDGTFQGAKLAFNHTTSGNFQSYVTYMSDVNGDGLVDLVTVANSSTGWSAFTSTGAGDPTSDYLVGLSNLSAGIRFSYLSLTNSAIYAKDTGPTASVYPKLDIQAPMYVVSSVSASNGAGGTVTTNYKYGGLKAELGTGRGMLGFRWLEATQAETGIVTRTEFKQDWPYTGLVSQTRKSLAGAGNNGILSQADNTYGCNDFVSSTGCTAGAGKRYYVYVNQSTESSWDVNGAALPTILTASQYDIWGNATQVSVSSSDGYSKVTTNSFSNDVSNWYLGRLNKASVTSTVP